MEQKSQSLVLGRLKKRAEFLAVRNGVNMGSAARPVSGKTFKNSANKNLRQKRRGRYFLLEIFNRDGVGDPTPRVGFTVTKKQGNAVQRNRIRRRLKEAVRLNSQLFANPYHDYVLVGHKDLLEADFNDIIYVLKQRFLSTKNSDRRRQNNGTTCE